MVLCRVYPREGLQWSSFYFKTLLESSHKTKPIGFLNEKAGAKNPTVFEVAWRNDKATLTTVTPKLLKSF